VDSSVTRPEALTFCDAALDERVTALELLVRGEVFPDLRRELGIVGQRALLGARERNQ
jgi:hypothetical protein